MFLETVRWMTLPLICGVFVTSDARGPTLRVPEQYPTIAAALAAARNGDRIIVADGVYTGPENRDLDFAGKRIRLVSHGGPGSCIIDCQQQGRAFHFHSGEPPAATLEGFTIQNGLVVDADGGGVLCDSSSPTIRNCIFRFNTVAVELEDVHGGGALANVYRSRTRVIDCAFEGNAQVGGGDNGAGAVASALGADITMVRCTFVRNHASLGGAIATPLGSRSRLRDCVFVENRAESGGGVACVSGSTVELDHCEFIDNVSESWGGGLACWGGSSVHISNCRFVGNVAAGGGGVGVWEGSRSALTSCVLSGNAATDGSGGGGLHVAQGSSAVVEFTVCSGNSGNGDGGAMAATGDADLTVQSCTLVGNEAPFFEGHGFGGAICAWSSRVTVANSVLYTNSAIEGTAFGMLLPRSGYPNGVIITVSSSVIQDGRSKRSVYMEDPGHPAIVLNWGVGNLDSPPRFRREPSPGADGKWGTPDDDFGDLHLLPDSPCIDAGDPNYVARPGETDIDGDPRVLDGDGDGVPVIDVGADEYVGR